MSPATLQTDPLDAPPAVEDASDYRALHTGALLGLLLALVSVVFPVSVTNLTDVQYAVVLLALPLAALAVSAWALASVRANRDTTTGSGIALAGVVLSALFLVVGSAYGGYVYATEVPEGYTRTSFQEMRPSDDDIESREPIPPAIQELITGESPVFLKGYIRPDSTPITTNVSEFLLVRDNNQCCFGDITKVMFYDQIMVTLREGLTVDASLKLFRVGGRLSVRQGNTAIGEPPLVYTLAGDYIQ